MQRSLRAYLWSIAILAVLAAAPRWAVANGADLPAEILLQGFAKPEDGRLRLLVRVPLVLLSSFGLPKRGPGYLDLARIDDKLKQVAAAAARQIELRDEGIALIPVAHKARISVLSDRSFTSYASARATLDGPPLPVETELFWNQGFFDTELEYPLRSSDPRLSVRMNVAPELGRRVKLRLEYVPVNGPARSHVFPGGSGWIALDPRWHEAAWLFLKAGFTSPFAIDRFAFLACLIAPFRQVRSLLALVAVLAGLQALTLTAVAQGALAATGWLAPLFDTSLAALILLLAIGNLAAPNLRRRWFISALVGALGGFGLGELLADASQFAGTHSFVAVLFFNLGVALGELVSLALAFAALRGLVDRALGTSLGVLVLSAVVGHQGWHWMMDRSHELRHALGHATASELASVALWMLPALLVGGAAWFPPQWRRSAEGRSARDSLN